MLSFTVIYLIRFFQAIRLWDWFTTLPLSVHPVYLALSGLVWGLSGLVLTVGAWRGKPWAARGLRLAAAVFAAYYWIDRLVLASDPSRWINWPFRLGATITLLLLLYWILYRPGVKAYFGETHG